MGGRKEKSLTLNGRTIKTQTLTSNGRSLKKRNKIKVASIHNPREIMFLETEPRKEEKEKSLDEKTPNPKDETIEKKGAQNQRKIGDINKIKINKTVRVISRHNPRNIRNISSHASGNEI